MKMRLLLSALLGVFFFASCRTAPSPKELALQSELDSAQRTIAGQESELASAKQTIIGRESELASAQKTIAVRDDQLRKLESAISGYETTIADIRIKLAALENELGNLSKGNIDVTREELTRDRDALRARTAELERMIADLRTQLGRADATIAELRAANLDLQESKDALAKSLSDSKEALQNSVANLMRQRDILRGQIDKLLSDNNLLTTILTEQQRKLNETVEQLKNQLLVEIERGDLDVLLYKDVIIVSIKDTIGFEPDSPVLRPEFGSILRRIADAFSQFPEKIVRIEGHTAVAPSTRWTNSWDLGAARAVSVVRYLQDSAGVDPTRLVALSFGEYRPTAPNTSEETRQRNRRVEIVLVDRPLYQVQELIQSGAAPR